MPIGTVINNLSIPVVINEAGTYVMSEDVSYSATTNLPPIIIAASNVTLDLLDFTISQTGGFGFTVTGIQVQSGIVVNIKNGKVRQFTQSGISAAAGTGGVKIDNMRIVSCGNRGIEFVGTAASPISESTITNCHLLASCTVATADYALTLTNVNYTVVQDSFIDLNGSSVITGTFACIRATGFRNQFLNVTMNDNTGNTDARGISLNNAVGTLIRKCNVNNLIASGGGAVVRGFLCEAGTTSTANIFQECIARALMGTNTVEGFLTSTNCNDNYFENCFSILHQVSGASGACFGFRSVANNRCTFSLCKAEGNNASASTATPYATYGFMFDSVTSNAALSCLAESQRAATGSSIGFYITQSTTSIFQENKAFQNSRGFDQQGTFNNNAWIKNVAMRNTGNAAQYVNFAGAATTDSILPQSVETISGPWTNVGVQ